MNTDSHRQRSRGAKALRTQLREAVRAQILDAAEELIAARGLHGASLVQIAKRAGVAVGTLYNYFVDRDAMVRALFEVRRASLRPLLVAAAKNAETMSFEQRLRRFMRDLLAAFDAHRRFLKVAMEGEHLKVPATSTANDIRSAIDEIIAAGVTERAIYKDEASLLAQMIMGAIRGVVLHRIAEGGEFARDADAVVSIFLDGARRAR